MSVSGTCFVAVRRGKRNSGRRSGLGEFFRKFNGLRARTTPYKYDLPTFVQSYEAGAGRICFAQVILVADTGLRRCLRILSDTHGETILTPDHSVLVDGGELVAAARLRVGDTLIVRGSMLAAPGPMRRGRRRRIVVEGLRYYSGGWLKTVPDYRGEVVYEYRRQHRAVLVVEAQMNNVSYDEYVSRLKHDPSARYFRTVPRGYVVHHLDEDPMNDAPENLEVLSKLEHDRKHADVANFNVDYIGRSTVQHIESAGDHQTFDILMADPCTNFSMNEGIIVQSATRAIRRRRRVMAIELCSA